jgi:hypothetical protein
MISAGFDMEKKLMAGFLENRACILKKKEKKSHGSSFFTFWHCLVFQKAHATIWMIFFFFYFQT